MQAIILAAGECLRFKPLSYNKHKSMVSIFGKEIIARTIENLINAGISDIIIVESPNQHIKQNIGDGTKFGIKIQYVVQKKTKGMGDAILQAEKYVNSSFFVLNANNFEVSDFITAMKNKLKETTSEMILLGRKTDMPWNYGIISLDKSVDDKVINLIEKPKKGQEPSDIRLIGIYLLPFDFFKYYKRVKVNQYAFEDALKLYMTEKDVRIVTTDKGTPTLKYSWDLFNISELLFLNMKQYISKSAKIDKSAKIEGVVHIGKNAQIFENVVIKGPCYIGNNCIIGTNVLIRKSVIEDNAMIGANSEVTRSIIMNDTHVHSGYFGDTIIGEGCRIGAGMITSNVRINRDKIKPKIKGNLINTNRKSLGVIIGPNTKLGINVSTMPGIIIGANCIVGPNTAVMENIESDTLYYSKFENIVKKRK